MNAVKELSSEFAAAVLSKVELNEEFDRQRAVNLIRRFHTILRPLMLADRQHHLDASAKRFDQKPERYEAVGN